ncbi:hypothetical protein D924_02845 [Enterococcus faecalis 06-MB-S-10]|nr:hypothetical protein D924_02845 [Enterococcus faecalis 06-MB-S-10]EPH85904.1 hypothetical protein D927_00217 [Enterococcus faecalis 02-MB-BW-10]EPH88175.1 hypothetical protein D923_02166 [Enterococcus faecalis 06-MB-S-04]
MSQFQSMLKKPISDWPIDAVIDYIKHQTLSGEFELKRIT